MFLPKDSDFKIVAHDKFRLDLEDTSFTLTVAKNFNLMNGSRKVAVELIGSLVYSSDGSLTLENGSE